MIDEAPFRRNADDLDPKPRDMKRCVVCGAEERCRCLAVIATEPARWGRTVGLKGRASRPRARARPDVKLQPRAPSSIDIFTHPGLDSPSHAKISPKSWQWLCSLAA
jgi:hypothetical protein